MKFIDALTGMFKERSPQPSVEASTLTPPPVGKAPKGQTTYPGYVNNVKASSSALPKASTKTATLDRLVASKAATSDYTALKTLRQLSPEVGTAIYLKLRTAIPEGYKLVGYDLDGQVSRDVTELAHELLRRLTFLGNPDGSFTSQKGLQSLSETLGLDCLQTGAMCLEVSLDKMRIPSNFNPVAVSSLVIYQDDKGFVLKQKVGGEEIDLDLPTVVYVAMDQDVTEAYAASPLVSSIQPSLADIDFNNDIRNALKRAVLPRLRAVLDSEKIRKITPPDILNDPEKHSAYLTAMIDQVESTINDLAPEEALVGFDYIEFDYIENASDPGQVIQRVQQVLNGKLASGLKSLPVTLGYGGSNASSSAESLLFLKDCNGIRNKLNEVYSKALTIAVRLLGQEGYVEFRYDSLDLRPETELEAWKAMKQSRVLELLSLGLITDELACIELTGSLPPKGMKPLSGTGFKGNTSTEVNKNPSSNTANATERNLTPDTPTGKRGSNQG